MERVRESGVQSVERAFRILEALSTFAGEAGVGELAGALGMPPSTVHRILQTLTERGYAMQSSSRRYSYGPGLIRLGDASTRRLSTWAVPALAQLSKLSQETANLALLDGNMATYVAQVPSKHQMRMFTEVGRRVFLHSTGVGKALLAQIADDQVLEIIRLAGMPSFTETTLTSEGALLGELREIRRQGYAVDEGEQEVGVRCYAMSVAGLPVPAAVSISGPEARVTRASTDRIVQALREAAMALRSAVPGE